jgi:hypothetical protein
MKAQSYDAIGAWSPPSSLPGGIRGVDMPRHDFSDGKPAICSDWKAVSG